MFRTTYVRDNAAPFTAAMVLKTGALVRAGSIDRERLDLRPDAASTAIAYADLQDEESVVVQIDALSLEQRGDGREVALAPVHKVVTLVVTVRCA